MAKNWKPIEAINAIKAGDKEAIMDIGRRFPLFLVQAATVNEAGATLLAAVPKYVTVRQIESILRNGAQDDDATDVDDTATADIADEETDEEPAPAPKKAKAAPAKADKPAKKAAKKAVDEEPADDDWDEEEPDEEPAPKKAPAKKATAKATDKPAKKAPAKKAADDDDDDWDL